jgi:hypothetical protein
MLSGKFPDVSEKRAASTFTVEEYAKVRSSAWPPRESPKSPQIALACLSGLLYASLVPNMLGRYTNRCGLWCVFQTRCLCSETARGPERKQEEDAEELHNFAFLAIYRTKQGGWDGRDNSTHGREGDLRVKFG